jgi:hypothetical protein
VAIVEILEFEVQLSPEIGGGHVWEDGELEEPVNPPEFD